MVDDVDFYRKIHPLDENKYKSGDKWFEITSLKEKIPLKMEETTIFVRSTHHGYLK